MLELYMNIKKKREELGLSQEQLAKKTGYTDRSSIAKIEKGLVDLPQTKINVFAEALASTPQELMGWDDSNQVFLKYLTSLGYRISQDDPEHKPFMFPRTIGVPCRLKYDTLDSLKLRIDSYAKATIDAELLFLQEEEIREERKEKERIVTHLKEQAHRIPKASHERTDIEVTDEMRQHDDDIMNDPDF